MIYLVGVGWSKDDITPRALQIIKKSTVFIDRYTSLLSDELVSYLKKETGKEAPFLSRSEMEEKAKILVENGRKEDIAIIIGGDPLIATTHKILFIEASKQKVKIEAIHAPSVFTVAIGESGLDFYRFGRTFTIPNWSEHYKPLSFYETLRTNMKNNMHSIALLDYDQEKMRSMGIRSAIEILEKAEESYKSGIINEKERIFVMHDLSLPTQDKRFLTIEKAKEIGFNGGVTTIIIPAKLSDIEKETIAAMYGA